MAREHDGEPRSPQRRVCRRARAVGPDRRRLLGGARRRRLPAEHDLAELVRRTGVGIGPMLGKNSIGPTTSRASRSPASIRGRTRRRSSPALIDRASLAARRWTQYTRRVSIWSAIGLALIATCCYQVGTVMQKVAADRMPRIRLRGGQGSTVRAFLGSPLWVGGL